MAYRLAPFNPTTPYDNQVITELNYANENFTILGQAFVNNDPSSQPILRASYVGPSAPSNPVAGMTWLNTSVNPPVIMVYDGNNWQAFYSYDPEQPVLSATHVGPSAPSNPVSGTTWLNTSVNPPVIMVYDGNNWQSVVNSDNAVNSDNVVNSDTVDGFHASQTPAPNTLLPLNANARIYDYVPRGTIRFDPRDFMMSYDTEHFIGSVNITTPSWSPSGAWKLIFVVKSGFYSDGSGSNTFIHRIKTTSYVIEGARWYWNSGTYNGLSVSDCFLIPELSNGTTQQFNFYVVQGESYPYTVFMYMSVDWYLFPA